MTTEEKDQFNNLDKKVTDLAQKISEANLLVKQLATRQQLNQDEINTLQVEVATPHKWYKDPSIILSVLALLLSVASAAYYLYEQVVVEEEKQKNRAQEIIQRLTEIYSVAGTDPAKMQVYQNEMLNLIDDAIAISDQNPASINANGYNQLIGTAYNLNKTGRLMDLFERGFQMPADTVTLFAMKNQYAFYNMVALNQVERGRQIYAEVVEMTRKQSLNPLQVTFNLATEYNYWASAELNISQIQHADSLLRIAESYWAQVSGRYPPNYPVAVNIQYARHIIDSINTTVITSSIQPPSSLNTN